MIGRFLTSPAVFVAMALLTVGTIVIPWRLAEPHVYNGLDRNLLYVEKTGPSRADFVGGNALITVPQGSAATLHLVTTPNDFGAAFNVVVVQDDSATPSGSPLVVRTWFPSSPTSIDIRFTSGSLRHVVAGTSQGGHFDALADLGDYELGKPYRVVVDWHKGKSAAVRTYGPDGGRATHVFDRSTAPDLFSRHFVNLSLDSPESGSNRVVALSDFSMVIPPQTIFAARASDWRLTVMTLAIVSWFLAVLGYQLIPRLRKGSGASRPNNRTISFSARLPAAVAVAGGILLLIAANIALSAIDGHPYDRLAQESYAYISDQYGIEALYERTDYVPDAAVRGGHSPWSSPPFAYPPVMAYPYWVIGHAWHLFRGPIAPMTDRGFLMFWKLALALFIVVSAWAIYQLTKSNRGERWALFGVGLYAINPAVLFDADVWGETEAILTAALLVSTIGFVKGKPRLGWSALIIAVLVKQTALFALPLLAIYSWKKYGLRRTFIDGCWGIITGFVVTAPLILVGYSPSTIYRSVAGQVLNFANPTASYASSDTFSFWTLANGLRGLQGFWRIWAPFPLMFNYVNLPFSAAGSALFIVLTIAVLVALIRGRTGKGLDESLFVSIAAVMCWYVAFSTLASARYLLLALPFLILALGISGVRARLLAIVALSTISFLSMYGVLMVIAVRGEWPVYFGLGNPSTNPLSDAVYQLYTSDWTITIGALALLLVAVTLTNSLFGRTARSAVLRTPLSRPVEP